MIAKPSWETVTAFVERVSEESVLLADGFEPAFLGLGRQFTKPPFAVYDRAACLAILRERDGMTAEEAEEFFAFNVEGGWHGEQTPVFVTLWSAHADPE